MTEEKSYRCEECGKTFDSERGLHIHEGQKHKEDQSDKANSKTEKSEDEENKYLDHLNTTPDIKIIGSTLFIIGFILGALTTIGLYEINLNDGQEPQEIIDLDDRPVLGEEDAPITIVSYEDFFCPYCGAFNSEAVAQEMGANSALPEIKEHYIDEGYVKFYFKHFPSQGGVPPAIASECVAEQDHDAFWDFHNEHYERTTELTELVQTDSEQYEDELLEIAEGLDIDYEEFSTCYENQETIHKVQQDFEEGQEVGVEGTPGIFVENEFISGAQPFSVFSDLIDAKLG